MSENIRKKYLAVVCPNCGTRHYLPNDESFLDTCVKQKVALSCKKCGQTYLPTNREECTDEDVHYLTRNTNVTALLDDETYNKVEGITENIIAYVSSPKQSRKAKKLTEDEFKAVVEMVIPQYLQHQLLANLYSEAFNKTYEYTFQIQSVKQSASAVDTLRFLNFFRVEGMKNPNTEYLRERLTNISDEVWENIPTPAGVTIPQTVVDMTKALHNLTVTEHINYIENL